MAGNLKSHFICFDFPKKISWHRCFLHSQPSLCSAGLSFTLGLFACLFFCRSFGLTTDKFLKFMNSCKIRRLKIVCAGDICLLSKLLLKFRDVLEYSQGRSVSNNNNFIQVSNVFSTVVLIGDTVNKKKTNISNRT